MSSMPKGIGSNNVKKKECAMKMVTAAARANVETSINNDSEQLVVKVQNDLKKYVDERRCAIYARTVTDVKNSKRLYKQILAVGNYAKSKGVKVGWNHIFGDSATSGNSNKGKGFSRLVKAVGKERIDVIFVSDVERFSRNLHQTGLFINLMYRNNVTVITVDDVAVRLDRWAINLPRFSTYEKRAVERLVPYAKRKRFVAQLLVNAYNSNVLVDMRSAMRYVAGEIPCSTYESDISILLGLMVRGVETHELIGENVIEDLIKMYDFKFNYAR